MSYVTTKSMLKKAQKEGYAVGAFNTSNLEITQAIIRAAQDMNSPVIVQASRSAIGYAGLTQLTGIVKSLAKEVSVPIALHLDHGPNPDMAKKVLKAGFSSVMIDASSQPFKDNIRLTKQVVTAANKYGVGVEAELGSLKGIEDEVVVSDKDAIYTDPLQAKEFVKKTGCSSLAVAIGTSHGAYKFSGSSSLDFKRLAEIRSMVSIPLVLHGASSIPSRIVKKAEKYGAKLGNAHGVSNAHLRKAIAGGICKINTDSDLRLAFDAAIREELAQEPAVFDPRKIIGATRDSIYDLVKEKMKLFGSSGRG